MEVLTSFIREKSPLQPEQQPQARTFVGEIVNQISQSNPQDNSLPQITTDVQAALTVIGRRNSQEEKDKVTINLSLTNLSHANLKVANLKRALLSGAHLEGAHLEGAHLEEAHLEGSYLEGAHLIKAHLEGAHLERVHLKRAHLKGANLKGANLKGAKNLTVGQVKSALNWESADYDDGFRQQLGLTIT